MSRVYLSSLAYPQLLAELAHRGHEVITLRPDPRLGQHTGAHADLRMCSLGDDRPVLRAREEDYRPDYPENARFCALFLKNHMIHDPGITAPELLREAEKLGLTVIPVKQGYARCSCAPCGADLVITADKGILKALKAFPKVTVLPISPGGVTLPGYDTGFFGGAAGLVSGTVFINGGLDTHPDGEKIAGFLRDNGRPFFHIPGLPLVDIGSIIEEVTD